jgi:hypothetical protein
MLDELKKPFQQQSENGFVLLLVLVTTMTLFITLTGILSLSLANLSSAKRTMYDTSALYVAEAGVDNAVFQLNDTAGGYTGTNTVCPVTSTGSNPVTVFNDNVKGKGTYESCVKAGSIPHEYEVYVVGKVYKNASAANPFATRKLRVVVEGSPVGAYAVQTGPGGMIMSNSANISQGPVYVGGYLTMSNSASIGTPSLPIAVNVANARCSSNGASATVGPAYPQVCNTGIYPDPITINGTQNHIYGTVNANNQTNSYSSKMTSTGLGATSGVAAPALPDFDRVAQVTAAVNNLSPSAATCAGNSGTVTWPANVKINGDVTISNNCTVIVSGDVWITGNFKMRNSAVIRVSDSVTAQPSIMVDGVSGVTTTQTSTIATNSAQIGMEFITFYSTNACTTATGATYCQKLTGTDLYNSEQLKTIDIGNQGAAAGSVFYAKYTKVSLGQAGAIGALLGQTIELAQSGNLVFTSTVVTGNYSYDVSYYEFGSW